MPLSEQDLAAIFLTFKVASTTTVLLILIATPLAYWLARTKSLAKGFVGAIVALPLVLPPTVLGFYFLIAMGPDGFIGRLTSWMGIGYLPFTFWGVVIASFFYSLPFVVQPIQNSIEGLGKKPFEVAATLGASPRDTFFSVILPQTKNGFITAAVLGFAHTVGEFGVVLMVGGNIPGVTQVVSVQIYEHVESMNYHQAHWLSITMIIFAFTVLTTIYWFNRRSDKPLLRFGR
ncbi:molybdate ABC transporter permease subunit [Aliikangiella sp. G2MR2-5]|uniref:molybdate ABC transporter permease subunit n=1 Tax=Aliikangiella sp. G2MR2-5 TaxID=2788943 RepID=UPI0018AA8F59|nr:molybdate ABC transporter permease subunit [Aliikangiella sp. G2MR2-5]